MLALILNGSPNPEGRSMRLARAVLDAAGVAGETAHLYRMSISPCAACGACSASFPCPGDDDMPSLRLKLDAADIVLAASPLHFTSLTAPLIACFSRLQPYWRADGRDGAPPSASGRRRAGGLVVTAGGEYARMYEPARAVTAAVFKTLSIPFIGMATAARTDSVRPENNPGAMAAAAALGRALAEAAGVRE